MPLDLLSFAILIGIAGLCVGSFLNVLIHRLPKMLEQEWLSDAAALRGEELPQSARYNLFVPASACPKCGHVIGIWENIPLLSYAVLRGRCRHCKAPISLRYPLVEILSALLSVSCALQFGQSLAGAGALIFVWALLALTFIDFDTQLLPDTITLPLLWGGLLFNLERSFVPLADAVMGAMLGYLILWSVYWLFKLATGKEGMGYGDFKLLSAIGAWLGWQVIPGVILISSLLGAVVGISLMIFARFKRDTPVPFGPYLAVGGMLALFFNSQLRTLFAP